MKSSFPDGKRRFGYDQQGKIREVYITDFKNGKYNKEYVSMKKSATNLYTEAALKNAATLLKEEKAYCIMGKGTWWQIDVFASDTGSLIAVFDLRDCYRKRAPLEGITKRFGQAVRQTTQPVRKKKKKAKK